MKKLYSWLIPLLVLTVNFSSLAAIVRVPYLACSPAENSTIESFEFELEFDFSQMVSNFGPSDLYGLRINAISGAEPFTRLYKGDVAPENLIAECVIPTQNYDSENFVTGSKLKFKFPGIPEDGVKYTVSFGNTIGACKKGEKTGFNGSATNYSTKPLNLVFTGKSNISQLQPTEWKGTGACESVSRVEALFPVAVSLTGSEHASLYLNQNEVAHASVIRIDEANPKAVIMEFDNVALIKDLNYLITLKAGSVADASDPSATNVESSRGAVGTLPFEFKFGQPSLIYNDNGLLDRVVLDIVPEEYHGYAITHIQPHSESSPNGTFTYTYPTLNDSEGRNIGNVSGTLKDGKYIIYTSSFTLSPDKEYYFNCPEERRDISINSSTTIRDRFTIKTTGDEIKFRTPGMEAGDKLPKIVLNGPAAEAEHHKNPELKSGEASLVRLNSLEIRYDYYKYTDSDTQEITAVSTGLKGNFYEMTENGDVLIKEIQLGTAKRGSNGLYLYPVATVKVEENLYAGKKYKIEIPADAYVPSSGQYKNWVHSEPFTFIVNGAMTPSCAVESCSYQEGDKIKKMTHAIFYMDNEVEAAEGKGTASFRCASPGTTDSTPGAITVINKDGKSILVADFIGATEKTLLAGGRVPPSGEKYKYYNLILPAGSFHLKGYPEITNEEYKVQLEISENADVVIVEPEFVEVSVKVNDTFHNSFRTVKGEKATIDFGLGPDWKVTSLRKNDYVVLDQLNGNVYTTVPLNEDTAIEALTEYAGEFMTEQTDGIFVIEGTPLKVYAEGGRIIIEGLTPGQEISVYSVSGLPVGTVRAEKDTVSISVSRDETYIIVVDGKAAKLLVK